MEEEAEDCLKVITLPICALKEYTNCNHAFLFQWLLYHFVQFGQGGTGGQAGRNLDVGHPEMDRGHLPDFGQSKSLAAYASSRLQCRADPQVVGDLAKAMDLE